MHFEGEFRVPGASDVVMRRFADVPRMARCMPGAVLEPQAEDGTWPGAMVVAFGPKKISFKGRVACAFDFAAKTGALHGRGTADMRAARIGVKLAFALHDDPAAAVPTTIVTIKSDAELGGVLADFARAGGVAVANVVMQDFARRAAEEFSRDAPPAAPPPAAAPAAGPVAGPAPATPNAGPAPAPAPPNAGPAAAPAPRNAGPATASAPPNAGPATAPAGIAPDAVVADTAVADAAMPDPALRSPPAPATAAPANAPPSAAATPPAAAPPPAAPAALAMHSVLWAVFKQMLRRLAQRLGLWRQDA